MQVSLDQVATVRALMEGDFARFKRMNAQLDRATILAYCALIQAAFLKALRRRFPRDAKDSALIDFVGDIRSRYEGLTENLDPLVAESLIRTTLTNEDDDLDTKTWLLNAVCLLYVLIADEERDRAGLDAVLTEARTLADTWIVDD